MRMLTTCAVAGLVLIVATTQRASGDLSLPSVISDHMVVQQGEPIPVWGWGDAGTPVTVTFDGDFRMMTHVHSDGTWSFQLPPTPASSDAHEIIIQHGDDRRVISDVRVGEVWLCSGQSNMVWTVKNSTGFDEVKATADRPLIRVFTVDNASVDQAQSNCGGAWVVCTPETVGGFSGVAYHFGKALERSVKTPIGLIVSCWGGSRSEAWTRPEALATVDAGAAWQERWWETRAAMTEDPSAYVGAGVDEGEWLKGSIPGTVTQFGIADGVDGIFWHRISTTIPERWISRPLVLSLGMIDDDDVTWFNGVEVGRTRGWQTPRVYDVPASAVDAQEVVIGVRVLDGAGPGGLHGDSSRFFLHPRDDPDDRISLAGEASVLVGARVQTMAAQHRPSHLYNGMIHPLLSVPIRGVTWYQGESNAIGEGAVDGYAQLLPLMIADWRDAWADPDLPFLMVQLANWDHPDDGWDFPGAREVQRRVQATTPGTGLAVTIDIGAANDIHPRNKHDVGERLARWALADVYGDREIVASGPMLGSVNWDDRAVRLTLETFGSDLAVRGKEDGSMTEVRGFEIAGSDGRFHPAVATLDSSDAIVVEATESIASPPQWVRYAWSPDPVEADLINAIGLPASGFLIERPSSD